MGIAGVLTLDSISRLIHHTRRPVLDKHSYAVQIIHEDAQVLGG